MSRIAVIGAGAWGSALAHVWAEAGNDVVLLARDPEIVESISTTHENRKYLPGINLSKQIKITANPEVLQSAKHVALVVPAQTIGAVFDWVGEHISQNTSVILCSKGIDKKSGLTPWAKLSDKIDESRLAVLSGPSFASDVALNKPTAVTLAATDIEQAGKLCIALSTPTFRLYANDDVVGVELGGALKNVIALAVGMVRGLGLGSSAEAALITRGFVELQAIVVSQGGQPKTPSGLSGLGDLVLTCSSPQSRNFSYGVVLASNQSLEGLPLAEGVHSAAQAFSVARQNGIDAPIIEAVVNVLDQKWKPQEAVTQLLSRPLKREI